MRKLLSKVCWIIPIFVLLTIMLMPAQAAETVVASGNCGADGANLQYTIYQMTDGNHKIIISGDGVMFNYRYKMTPWLSYSETLTEVDLSSGITTIGDYAFYKCANLTLSELPSGITIIGKSAFEGCTNLALSELPSGITTIGSAAFKDCSNLTLSELPNGITSIGGSAFWECPNITISKLPDGITRIAGGVFRGCKNIALTELPDGITRIDDYAFWDCSSLALTKLPDKVIELGFGSFYHCTNLALTELPDGITYIPGSCFFECPNLALKELPSGIKSISSAAFYKCTNLALTELPEGITSIMAHAFGYCPNLTLTKLPSGITSIEEFTFADCTNLALTELPDGITNIDTQAFRSCENLALKKLPASCIPQEIAFEDAQWACDAKVYKENLDGAGYTLSETVTIYGKVNKTILTSNSRLPSYDHYSFNQSASEVALNTTLYPSYEVIEIELFYSRDRYSVTFETDGGSSVATQTGISFETTADEPEHPTKHGYDFAGWFADEGLTISYNFNTPITADLTIYAAWSPRSDTPYKVRHYQQDTTGGGYTLKETDELTGTTDAVVEAVAKSFTGFHQNVSHPDRLISGAVAPDGSLVLTLYYDRDTYTVSFDSNMGTVTPESKTVLFGTTYGALPVPTRGGFDFDGWYTDLESGDKVVADTSIQNQNHILYAHWLIPEGGTVGGIVVDEGGHPVPNANVTIRAGTVDYKVTYTDALGRFSMSGVEYGIYNLVAEKNAVVTTAIIHVTESNQDYTLVMPAGQTNSILIVEPGSPEIVVGGLDALYENEEFYPAEEQAVVAAGGSIVVTMAVAEKSETDLTEEAQKIKAAAGTDEVVLYLDMSVTKSTTSAGGDHKIQELKELPQLLQIIVPLSAEMQGKQGYTVYRIHEGEVDAIKEAPNEAGEYLTVDGDSLDIYVSKFSLYGVAYQKPSGGGGGSSGGSGGTHNPGPKFEDVLPPDWFYEDVMNAVKKGYMEGITKTKFCPNDPFTRAQAAYASATLQGAKPDSFDQRFEDVTPDTGYAKAIIWADDAGVAIGYGNGCFGPTDGITREQMALILYRQFGDNTNPAWLEDDYTDADEISEWAMDAVRWAVARGLLKGNELGELLPQGGITRTEAAAMLMRADRLK